MITATIGDAHTSKRLNSEGARVSTSGTSRSDVRPVCDSSYSAQEDSQQEDQGLSDGVLRYINQMLMEEDLEEDCMIQESLELQAAEKSFYEAIGKSDPSSRIRNFGSSQAESSDGTKFPDLCNGIESVSLFIKGVEEASKLIPSSEELVVSSCAREIPKKHHNRNFSELEEERSGKQAAVDPDTYVHSDTFDEVLLNHGKDKNKVINDLRETLKSELVKKKKQNVQSKGSGGGGRENQKEVVDLRTLLINCAEAVTADDHRTADELLSQIRQNSSPFGDGNQRLAHYLANGLEARLAGIGSRVYNAMATDRQSSVGALKAYLVHLAACPFRKVANLFSSKTIFKLTRCAARIHIIHLGIHCGFQWPTFFQYQSLRLGGPPQIRITGIDIPQPGFRPARRVEEAGRMLAHYAREFRVPFEFNPIVKRWENIQLEDFKLEEDEMVIVNCIYRMKNLPDETMVADSSRNAILDIIRKINPALFVQGVINAAYNAPFFLTRFNEALFHFSSVFDMLETVMPRESEERMLLEKVTLGKEILNVVACEGWERIERPETYKQWKARTCRAGFLQLPLVPEIKDRATFRVNNYHKDFVIDQDGHWLLLGWKGRILCALSTWKPAYSTLDDFEVTTTIGDASTIKRLDSEDVHLICDSSCSAQEDNRQEDQGLSDEFLRYINQILMEEDLEEDCIIQDSLELQAAEKSFSEAIRKRHPSSPNRNFGCSEVVESVPVYLNTQATSSDGTAQVPDLCNGIESVSLIIKGVEEVSKLIPSSDELVDSSRARGIPRKHHYRNFLELEEEERNVKQAAVYPDGYVHSDTFDEILLNHAKDQNKAICDLRETLKSESVKKKKQNVTSKGSCGRSKENRKEEVVDLRTLLINCAEAVTTDDHRTADEMLSKIRKHASPFGDGNQRLSHYLANGLEARLAGIGSRVYNALATDSPSSVGYVKANLVHLAAFPFRKVSNLFSNKTILKLTRCAARIHIIHFGIKGGFQWPSFIQCQSKRLGGPPQIRITGIDIPQPGFRPARRVEETGRMLAHYAKEFRVPFVFNPIAKRWDNIQLEDFKLEEDEMVIVNCIYQMKNLPDETMVADSSRYAILDIIRKINPAVFVQGVINAAYNAPFFLTRFKEALFHFSSVFDMFETVMPWESEERMLVEKEVLGKEVLNVVACEGWERIERPETYKQWQARTCRAGFLQLPLDPEIKDRAMFRVNTYHKDFVIDEDGHWLLLGWKGRILCALSTWKPAYSTLDNFEVTTTIGHASKIKRLDSEGARVSTSSPSRIDVPLICDSSCSAQEDNRQEDQGLSDEFLRYINQILMEEDLEADCMIQDSLELQAAEKSFSEAICKSHTSSPNRNFGCSEVVESVPVYLNTQATSSDGTTQVPELCNGIESVSLFIKGVEEVSKLIPSSDELVDSSRARGIPRKHHYRNYSELGEEERSSKQAAVYPDTYVHSDTFDEVLLNHAKDQNKAIKDLRDTLKSESVKKKKQNVQSKGSGGGSKENRKEEVVDLRTLLINCAEAVTTDDYRTVDELLSQIRQHSSPFGDGNQRLAHYLANGLEARLAGIGIQVYNALATDRSSSVGIVKAHLEHLAACPFRKVSNLFSNKTILKLTRHAARIHIIHFGIQGGFQWPSFIQRQSERLGGPPKIRMTGIDIPQPGFRPARRVEEAGRMLAHYAKEFRVPFEFNPIVKRWETIQLEDIKPEEDEMVIVNCIYQMKYLPDETMVDGSSRNAILDIIRKINPAVFVQGVLNGAYNAPFYLSRFKEVLFHFSSVFDMFETVLPRESEGRMLIEKEILGKAVLNVVACEGWERIERPERYRQWQARTCRAGFLQLPLDPEIKDRATFRVNTYHKDFVIDQNGHWLLLGWKGRILCALSTWKPA